MNVVIINKSDSRGGAAVVSRRLMDALCDQGINAKMLVAEKQSDSPRVIQIADRSKLRKCFLTERLRIFTHNGFSRQRLFQVDIASDGLDLASHPLVREADIVVLGWVNQGLLSLKQIADIQKPLVWIMHDMWNMTGICHHAGDCDRFHHHCGKCQFLGRMASAHDLSYMTFERKKELYDNTDIHFVAVSRWLAGRARESGLLGNRDVEVINNPFLSTIHYQGKGLKTHSGGSIRIVMGAARLDDPIKGLQILKKTLAHLKKYNPGLAAHLELITFGVVRDETQLEDIAITHRHLGRISPKRIGSVYADADIVVSSSLWETLPGTLVEGQAYGCIPICFNRGGQPDIITHKQTGYIAEFDDNKDIAAANLAAGIIWASWQLESDDASEWRRRLQQSVTDRFAPEVIAEQYIALFRRICDNKATV